MADQPLVNWDALRPTATGPRHYAGPEVQQRAVWKCPACGEQNEGVLEQGCVHCGNGGGAKHVGVDPIVVKPKGMELDEPEPVFSLPIRLVQGLDVQQAFLRWIQRTQDAGPMAAFQAGWTAAVSANREAPMTPPSTPAQDEDVQSVETRQEAPVEDPPLFPGTIEDRTLHAALIYFVDQVLSQTPEECETGEWLTPAAARTLLAERGRSWHLTNLE